MQAQKLEVAGRGPCLPGGRSWLLGLLFLVGVQSGFAFAASPAAGWALEVFPNGTVLVRGGSLDAAGAETTEIPEWSYEFGLPPSLPLRQSPKDGVASVLVTEWKHQEIRYVQSILCLGLGPAEDPVPVLLVQISGESLANEYTDAAAAFGVERRGEPVELELCRGWVYAADPTNPLLLAAVQVEAGAVAAPTGRVLRFRAHMPPGTSGAMTLGIPFRPVLEEALRNDLQDLNFDDEVRRARKTGAASEHAGWLRSARGSWVFPVAMEAASRP